MVWLLQRGKRFTIIVYQPPEENAITIRLQNFNYILPGSNDFVMIASCKKNWVMVYYRSKIAFVQGGVRLYGAMTAADHTLGGKP